MEVSGCVHSSLSLGMFVLSSHDSSRVLATGLVSSAGWVLAAKQALAAKQIPCTPIEACRLVRC